MVKINNLNCLCKSAVKNAYKNLMQKGERPTDALNSAMHILKYYHPEINDSEIPKKTAVIINPELENFFLRKKKKKFN